MSKLSQMFKDNVPISEVRSNKGKTEVVHQIQRNKYELNLDLTDELKEWVKKWNRLQYLPSELHLNNIIYEYGNDPVNGKEYINIRMYFDIVNLELDFDRGWTVTDTGIDYSLVPEPEFDLDDVDIGITSIDYEVEETISIWVEQIEYELDKKVKVMNKIRKGSEYWYDNIWEVMKVMSKSFTRDMFIFHDADGIIV